MFHSNGIFSKAMPSLAHMPCVFSGVSTPCLERGVRYNVQSPCGDSCPSTINADACQEMCRTDPTCAFFTFGGYTQSGLSIQCIKYTSVPSVSLRVIDGAYVSGAKECRMLYFPLSVCNLPYTFKYFRRCRCDSEATGSGLLGRVQIGLFRNSSSACMR